MVIGGAIGLITSLLGIVDARSKVAFTDADQLRVLRTNMLVLLVMTVAAITFGFIASSKRSGQPAMVIFGVLMIACGVFTFIFDSYFPGVVFAAGGLVSSLGALFSKDFAKPSGSEPAE